MGLAEEEGRKEEKIDGVIYDMSPSANYIHGMVNSNIHTKVKAGLRDSLCLSFMENLDFKYQPEESDNYVIPDVMVICDRKRLRGGSYSGVPKFIVETLSPSTAMRDMSVKKEIYEKAGVSEYWIVSQQGSVEIYYLEQGSYKLTESYILQDDEEEEEYNAEQVISLREFPNITMTLAEIFENVD